MVNLKKIIFGVKKSIAIAAASTIFLTAVPMNAYPETVYNKIHNVSFSFSGTKYKKGMQTTELGVKVDKEETFDVNGISQGKEINLMVYTEDWNKRKENPWDYVTITNLGTNLTVALPKGVELKGIKQHVRYPKKEVSGNFASSGWAEVRADRQNPMQKLKLEMSKGAGGYALTAVSGMIGGLVVGGAALATKFGIDLAEYNAEKARINREVYLEEFAKNHYASTIPILSVDKNITARKFIMPLENSQDGSMYIYLNISLKQGLTNSERAGQLERLLIEVPLGEEQKNDLWTLFIGRNLYSKPNLESKRLSYIKEGTKIDVLKQRIESPTNEEGGRGGIQIYDKISVPELDVEGYIPRAGDDIAPFSKTGKFEDAPGNYYQEEWFKGK